MVWILAILRWIGDLLVKFFVEKANEVHTAEDSKPVDADLRAELDARVRAAEDRARSSGGRG